MTDRRPEPGYDPLLTTARAQGSNDFNELRKLAQIHPKRIGGWVREPLPSLADVKLGDISFLLYRNSLGTLGASVGDGSIYGINANFFVGGPTERPRSILAVNRNTILYQPEDQTLRGHHR